jgi:hypothetical protein
MAELGPYNPSSEMRLSFDRANSVSYDMKGGRLCLTKLAIGLLQE